MTSVQKLRARSGYSVKAVCLLTTALAGTAILPATAPAASLGWVYSFTNGTDGANPIAGLYLDQPNSYLYGAAFFAGANGQGTLFRIPTSGGSPSVLHAFSSSASEGAGPGGTPTLDTGNSAGTAVLGTTTFASINSSNVGSGNGTVYSFLITGSTYSVVHTFSGGTTDGANSYAGLLNSSCSSSGTANYYGTTTAGGTSNAGTLFKLTPSSSSPSGYSYSFLYSVAGISGQNAYGPLGCDNYSTLYGTTVLGGSASRGLNFSITTSGGSPAATNQFGSGTGYGSQPRSGLLVLNSTHLLGVTTAGGTYSKGVVYLLTYTGGTAYSYTTIYNFGTAANDGSGPWGTLIADGSNNLYGTTTAGGTSGNGTAFKCTKGSGYTWSCAKIYNFAGSSDGANPYAGLAIDGSGNLYGTAKNGGANGYGTIFQLTP